MTRLSIPLVYGSSEMEKQETEYHAQNCVISDGKSAEKRRVFVIRTNKHPRRRVPILLPAKKGERST